jgi:DNA repair protein SbcC/Rad50
MAMDNARINSIILKNIKSFSEGNLCFEDGVTVISGENGAGKSTIFEALGYCLFGVDTKSFIGKSEHFVREDESRGEVSVEYTGTDGKDYRVVRKTKGGTSIEVFGDDGWFPLEGVEEPHEIIRKTLGLRSSIELAQQFEEIIGPFQADFITPFILTGVNRRKKFDRVLGIDRWRDLYENTSSWGREISQKISDIEREINFRKTEIQDLPELIRTEKDLKNKRETVEVSLKTANARFSELDKQKSHLETMQKSIVELESELVNAKGKMTGRKEILVEVDGKIEKAEQSVAVVEKAKPGHNAYTEYRSRREKLEQDRVKRDNLSEKINELGQFIAGKKAGMDSETKTITARMKELKRSIEKVENDINEKSTLLETAGKATLSVKDQLEEAEKYRVVFNGKNSPIEEIRRRKQEVETLLDYTLEIEKTIQEKVDKIKAIPELEKRINTHARLEQEISDVRESLALFRHDLNEKKKGLALLKEGVCPFFNEYCLNLEEKDPDTYFRGRIGELNKDIRELELDLKEKEEEMERLKQDQQLLISLRHVQDEVEKDRKKLESQAIRIRDVFKKGDLDDLYSSFMSAVRLNNDSIIHTLNRLEKDVSDFCFSEHLNEIPESLNSLAGTFSKADKAVSGIIEKTVKAIDEEFRTASQLETRVNGDLKHLNDKKREIEDEISSLSKRGAELEHDKSELLLKENEKNDMVTEIEQFKGLDHQLDEAQKKMQENLEDFDAFKEHEKTASEYDGLVERKKKINLEINELEKQISDITTKMDILKTDFNPEELDRVRSRLFELGETRASLDEQLRSIDRELSRYLEEIDKKKKTELEIVRFEKDRNEWEKTREFANFLRNQVFNRIAPNVADILREQVSETANNIYRVISGKNEELFWGDDYSVRLIDMVDGRKRERVDRQLSGGQFMSAVIAIRLALLKTIGSPFAFFDEPTSHLDEERRKNLAEAFRTLNTGGRSWYRQLFLVSHDESFQDISGNLIELALDDKRCTRIINPSLLPSGMSFIRVSVE